MKFQTIMLIKRLKNIKLKFNIKLKLEIKPKLDKITKRLEQQK